MIFPIEGGDVSKGARAELATWALGTVAGQAATRVSTGLQWRWLIPGALGFLWGVCRRGYTGMSLSTSQLNQRLELRLCHERYYLGNSENQRHVLT